MTIICHKRSARRSRSDVTKMKLQHGSSCLSTVYHTRESKSKRGLKYITTRFERWNSVHFVLLTICTFNYFYFSSRNHRGLHADFWSDINNESLVRIRNFKSMQSEWCLSSATFLNHTNSYAVMDQSINILYIIGFLLSIIGILSYIVSLKLETNHRASLFGFGILILFMFVGSSVCNQLITSFICRPVEILYDSRYTSMVALQIFIFITSLHLAYGIGRTFGSVFGHPKPSQLAQTCPQTKSNDYILSTSPMYHIP